MAIAESPASVVKVEMLFVVILCTGYFFFSFLFFSLCKSARVVRRGRGGIHAERVTLNASKHFYFHDKKPML